MKYITQVIKALLKLMLISLGVVVLVSVLVYVKASDPMPLWKPLCIGLIAWLLLWAVLVLMISASLKKEEPLDKILAEKGCCDEWLQKHSEIYPVPDRSQKLRRVDVLSYLGRYDEAKAILDSLSTLPMNDNQTFEYHNARLDMLLTTGHYDEAIGYLEKCRKFMDIYSGTNPMYGAVYGCNAGVILALAGDFDGSQHYLDAAEKVFAAKPSMSMAIPKIARTMQLYALDFIDRAEQQEAETAQYIINDTRLTAQWQKDHFLDSLKRAKRLLPANRHGEIS